MNATQQATPDIAAWIRSQTAAGQPRALLLQSMLASGWSQPAAVAALCAVLDAPQSASMPALPVPDPLAGHEGRVLTAGDRAVHVLAVLDNPRVIVIGGLLSDDECDEMIEQSRRRLTRSETVQTDTGSSEVNDARTSEGMFFERAEFPLCERIEARMAALMRWPVENGEGLQILRYRAGAEYRPHYDYFDPAQPGTPALLRRGGQRVASLVCYLNTPAKGGGTVFPDVGLEVAAIKGNAVFFSYDRPHPSTRSLHGGAPVLEGEKWVATKWVRERRFD
ncbi:MAG TPA: 2OG-Fe(II) oxygenase [Caldimonas sp.]|nr:2OG-Fe(II) oxygenase [Caldimonas sp.]